MRNSGIPARPPIPHADIRRQLDRILSFRELQASDRRREMLKFVVEEALAGNSSGLKGTNIAMAVFGRRADFDQQTDPVVRLEARKLRRDLDNYYAGAGRDDPVRVDIPKGRYVPTFAYQGDAPGKEVSDASVGVPGPLTGSSIPWRLVAIGTVTIAIIVVLVSLVLLDRAEVEADAPKKASNGSLFVEGFRALDESEDTILIAEGVTQELVSDLLRFAHLRVHFAPAEAETDIPTTQFAMSGTVGRNGEAYVVSARLIRNGDGQLLWSDSFTEATSAKSLMEIQDEVATQIATVVGQQYGIIENAIHEAALADDADPELDSYICVARGLIYRRTVDTKNYKPTRQCLEEAVKRDPDYADAWAMLAHLRFDAARFGFDPELSGDEGFFSAREAAERALAINPNNIEAYKVLSFVEEYLGNFDAAISMAERALAVNPNAPDALANLGNRLTTRGRFEEGVPLLKQALERMVKPIPFYYQMIAVDHMMRSEWEEMLEVASRAVADNSGPSYALLAIAQGGLGNSNLAQTNLDAMAERSPILAEDPRAAFERYRLDSAIVDALVDGLAMARAVASES